MLINYQNVTINQGEQTILQDVNLSVSEGEFVFIIGKVGSGKSTLLQSLYCESEIISAATCEVLGHDLLTIRRRDIPGLRKQMGIIFQDFQLLSDRSIERNLRFVLRATGWKGKSVQDERIEYVLTQVGMRHCRSKMPHELSGGEQQRIAIARALLNEPKLIVADEPTANLDAETAEKLIALLEEIRANGTAVVMSTHNMNIVQQHEGKVFVCHDNTLSEKTGDNVQP